MPPTGDQIRKTLLEIVADLSKVPNSLPQAATVLQCASQALSLQGKADLQRSLLTYWHDLFRTGYLAWGGNLANPNPPFFHVTEQGRRALAHLSRDPSNPDGYFHYLASKTTLPPVAESYIREALRTYSADCSKATAVLVGAAAESMALALRDSLCAKLDKLREQKPRDLDQWSIKRVLDAMEGWFRKKKDLIPDSLYQAFDSYWPAFTHQIRTVRNDAGHPKTVNPVTDEAVHAALLIFPELADMVNTLIDWVENSYGSP